MPIKEKIEVEMQSPLMAEIIPDYCEIDKFIRECLEGENLVIEEAASKLKKKLVEDVHPSWIMVESAVNDASHGNVVVMV